MGYLMEEQEVLKLIKEQCAKCDEKYVLEHVFWHRIVRMIVIVITMLMTTFAGLIAWGFKTSTEITNNTQGRRDLERRIDVIERQNTIILQNHDILAKNQQTVLDQQTRLIKKLDILIDRDGK